ncbi:MAG: carboxypeptidase regulatory-like domain-containing protein [Nitrospirae bacterium]|nr:carboxypeptidase regulatory-like domain-containing protein [Nitrospirota bacterium]
MSIVKAAAVLFCIVSLSFACQSQEKKKTPVLDTTALLVEGETRAGKITDEAALIKGPAGESELGDYRIYNDKVAFVIHNEQPSDGYIHNGGAIIDADLIRSGGEPGQDMIKEYSPIFGLMRLQDVDTVTVVDPGGFEKPAVIEAEGRDGTVEFGAALAGAGGGTASSVIAALDLGRDNGLKIRTRYTLGPSSNAIRIETFVKNDSDEHWPRPLDVAEFLTTVSSLLSAPDRLAIRRALATFGSNETLRKTAGDAIIFSDHAADPYMLGVGFNRKEITDAVNLGLLLTTGVETPQNSTKMLGAVGERHEVAYGLFLPDDQTIALLAGPGLTGDFMIFGAYEAEIELDPGQETSFVRYLAVGRDVAELNGARLDLSGIEGIGTISGNVKTDTGASVEGARVHALDGSGNYDSMAVTRSGGSYSMRLPAGEWTLSATGESEGENIMYPSGYPFMSRIADGYAKGAEVKVSLPAEGSVGQELTVGETTSFNGTIKDSSGTLLPGKISFLYDKMPDPSDEEARQLARLWVQTPYRNTKKVIWTSDGQFEGQIEPGKYRVTASLGFEYDIHTIPVTFAAGEKRDLNFVLRRAVDLKDISGKVAYVSIDSHRHAGPSNHGEARAEDSIITNLAEGLWSFASSDHDIVTDYRPLIQELGLQDKVVAFNSVEISTAGVTDADGKVKPFSGHFNPFPVLLGGGINKGAPIWWAPSRTPGLIDGTPASIFKYAREKLLAKVIQINHGGDDGYFCWRGYDPATHTAADPLYSDNYELMEIINGKGKDNWLSELTIWYGQLNFGGKTVGVAVSDSHHRLNGEPGYGRTYVGVPVSVNAPKLFTDEELIKRLTCEGVEAGKEPCRNYIVSGGPFIRVRLVHGQFIDVSKGIGDTLKAKFARLQFEIHAPTWMGKLDFRINENGKTLYTSKSKEMSQCAQSATGTKRFDCDVTVSPSADAWYNIETRVEEGLESANTLDPVYPGAIAFAVTGPLYLDVDSNGWTPPNTAPEIRRRDGKNCD